ncbi:MAG: hypothetical protein IIU09_04260 [Bacteroidales bacterium]|nr:hypothetical protein [Bacteroidales bacterium]
MPSRSRFSGEAQRARVVGRTGALGILPKHPSP